VPCYFKKTFRKIMSYNMKKEIIEKYVDFFMFFVEPD